MSHEPVELVAVPCNLGLRPRWPGHVPGTWRAPERLIAAGLGDAVGATRMTWLDRPAYSPDAQAGTRLYNGHALRALNLRLAEVVTEVRERESFPLVVGGDCSILLGALTAVRREGPVTLIHVDGHSDFRHPGNYDPAATLGAIAGMDLALATGRGEALLTDWPGVNGPLVRDDAVIQIGERESRDADFAWPDIAATAIHRIDVFKAEAIGARGVIDRVAAVTDAQGAPVWLHLDVDVLDQRVMPAVDSPGSPGVAPDDLVAIGQAIVAGGRCRGMTLTVFDPDGRLAALIVALVGCILEPLVA